MPSWHPAAEPEMQRLTDLFRTWAGTEPADVTPLPLSGSARKYYRMSASGVKCIGCIGTNLLENKAFLSVDSSMLRHGINAPRVFGVSTDGMTYLQEDLGDGQLFSLLGPNIESGDFTPEQMGWLKKVMRALPTLQFRTGDGLDWGVCFPDREFNSRMVDFDLNYFKYDFLKFTGLDFNEIRLQDDFDALRCDSLDFSGETFMYRDFQARNVMIRDGEPYFIDFQGGRRGPIQYDLASFLWNAGTHFKADLRRELEEDYMEALGGFMPVDKEDFHRRYRLLTLVRLLQEMGAYGLRGLVERKQIFLDCIPTALRCLKELTSEPFERYPYLTEVLKRLSCEWDGTTIFP